ncbi:XRE family transcriptional regulator [Xanthomonas axonopodis pv. clitoriae]|uniref:XRE family transcriptional regulator n=1 Tax=Xanthomonas axonopodis pv. clitoriae TaxID=487828 RepID=A0AB73N8T4_9XANT|nr:XRE family transcriptional regulator [Xanthomonas oryzae pv. oryzae]OOW84515.1 XRE family transcriptional regulator [Xanthomonas axonopodis pv. clitoriae]
MGVPQQTVGVSLGLEARIAQSRISRYETGMHVPDLKTALELAEALGVSLSSLVADTDRLAQIIELVRQLSDEQQEELTEHLSALTGPAAKTPEE